MSTFNNPSAVSDGLVFAYDMGNLPKSFKGGPVTNLIPSPGLNAYPTTGNGWGTYNTNQYNSGSYFSIGSISSVSSNIVTTSGNHPLRTYDVVTPQTSGGGVTSGTNYLVKKLSDTTFCLYPYNGSQDGSQGYISSTTNTFKVYDDFANDNKVSINSSSFPTMWWGPPHLPNSGLVKEIRTRGFTNPYNGDVTDCMRLHYIRTDDVKDHMAYGVDTSMTPGTPHTVSFYYRAVDDAGVGKVIQYYVYNYTSSAAGYAQNFTLSRDWQKFVFTYTPAYNTSISYWFMSSGGVYSWDLACIQIEVGSVANQFVAGSRTNTQTLLDLTGLNTITASSLTYASDNTFSFNASSTNYMNGTMNASYQASANSIDRSWEVFVKPTTSQSTAGLFGHVVSSGCSHFCNGGVCIYSGNYAFNWYDNSAYQFLDSGVAATSGQWAHVVGTYSSSDNKTRIYVNGILKATYGSTTNLNYGGYGYYYQVGYLSASGNYFTGDMSVIRYYYNKALSSTEVEQNFQALRGRFGI